MNYCAFCVIEHIARNEVKLHPKFMCMNEQYTVYRLYFRLKWRGRLSKRGLPPVTWYGDPGLSLTTYSAKQWLEAPTLTTRTHMSVAVTLGQSGRSGSSYKGTPSAWSTGLVLHLAPVEKFWCMKTARLSTVQMTCLPSVSIVAHRPHTTKCSTGSSDVT